MNDSQISQVIDEELATAKARIMQRIHDRDEPNLVNTILQKPLPENENYTKALVSYKNGGTHSGTAKELGVSMAQIKKYYTWLVKNGYLPIEHTDLSVTEQRVVDCIFNRKMSIRETAQELGCSVSNVTYRRDSAFRKGYEPQEID